MGNCRETEQLFASYVDHEAAPAERAAVDTHLERCPECRHRVDGERTARAVMSSCRDGLRVPAPGALRARCAPVPAAPVLTGRRSWLPLSIAASLLLAVGAATLFFLLSDPVPLLATHLADDHDQCFMSPPAVGEAGADTASITAAWLKSSGWPLHIASSSKSEQLELLGLRRCRVTEGRTAHLLYRWRGEPLSVFVLPQAFARRSGVEQIVEKFGHEAIVW